MLLISRFSGLIWVDFAAAAIAGCSKTGFALLITTPIQN